jgi:serine/threonine protein kinase
MVLPTDAVPVGAVGDYDLMVKIGEGGAGTVYKGRHRRSGQVVAIKVFSANTTHNPVMVLRCEQEFRAASRLRHPHMVRAFDLCRTESMLYLVMEYVEGESLGDKVERDGPLPEAEAVRLIVQVCQALEMAHQRGLIHRDVKPDNILVTPTGEAKLTDLGLAKELFANHDLTRTGRGLGTPHYMAPEQFRDAKSAQARCDIYGLGATLYTMVTGELPFGNCSPWEVWKRKTENQLRPPREVLPALSKRLDWAIRRAMSPEPALRPASCREFTDDLTAPPMEADPKEASSAQPDDWFVLYHDPSGQLQKLSGSTQEVRRWLDKEKPKHATQLQAGRTQNGPFKALSDYPEFRDLLIAVAPPAPSASCYRQGLVWLLPIAMAVITCLIASRFFFTK